MFSFVKKLFGNDNDRKIKQLAEKVDYINSLEPQYRAMSDQVLISQTADFKQRLFNGEDLESILPNAFAVVREAASRVLGQRHFDVQIMGGLVLHSGKIAEMKTGEGKTLSATLPVYTNALTGRGVHVVTVNDYLARRDAEWMGYIYNFLGLTSGSIVAGKLDEERREAYLADVTYGTNNEFGFDYLRDNMKFRISDYVQREFNYAIVDEVDSILIDEARTPLIISGAAEKSTDLYHKVNKIIPVLKKEEEFLVDEKAKSATLTEAGITKAEQLLSIENLYDPSNIDLLHHLDQALKAHTLFSKDTDYIVKDGRVLIVDEFTGRLMEGRRYGDGLHQALEAKENVKIENENQTYASITFQNYFRMYAKLAGMTGTAETEAEEFAKIYNLEVVSIPPHRKMVRNDYSDVIYKTVKEKYEAVIEEIIKLHKKGQPVLVGTISIAHSEFISKMLKDKKVTHSVLNAKQHEAEAKIIAESGQRGSVTIATNMAGRGTDIVLGEDVADLGGLFILGTERHESRRIDNQLRGRSGRQGDPGASRFYLSLEDDLMRVFGGEWFQSLMGRLGMGDGVPLESATISRRVEGAQKHMEAHHFEIRKHLLEYDDVMNRQRSIIYSQRRQILSGENINDDILDMLYDQARAIAGRYTDLSRDITEIKWETLQLETFRFFNFKADVTHAKNLNAEELTDYIYENAKVQFDEKCNSFPNNGVEIFKYILLNSLDSQWKDHLYSMDRLKSGIGLRGYAQQNPLREYQREGFEMFNEMVERVREESLSIICRVELREETKVETLTPKDGPTLTMSHGGDASDGEQSQETVRREGDKVGRNDPCPCGSEKKYKNCCGK